MILLVLDAKVGEIDRYVTVPHKERIIRTHGAKADRGVIFTAEIVKTFRDSPPEQYRIRPDPPKDPQPPGTTSPVRDVLLQAAA